MMKLWIHYHSQKVAEQYLLSLGVFGLAQPLLSESLRCVRRQDVPICVALGIMGGFHLPYYNFKE